jgi:endonuclease/exonuclease/phosphatase family metal-dependent hydrolase
MFRKLQFLVLFLLISAAACFGGTVPVTIVSANLSDNTSQAYESPGIRLLQALRPDIVGIQEFNYKAGTSADLVRTLFGPDYHFARERGGASLPNGILSRYPILASGQWEDPYVKNRCFAWATIAIPGAKPLHVVSVHLVRNHPEHRVAEARHLLELVRASFPTNDYVVLCGDFNTASRSSEALAELTAWFDDSRQPSDQEGNRNTSANRNRPHDFVLPNPALAKRHASTIFGGKIFPDGLVFDSRLWNPPPSPAQREDTGRNLQHLPVMKTFRIPVQ